MKFTQLPTNVFKNLTINAGIMLKNFTPASGTVTKSDIVGATSGGLSVEATPSFTDFGEDIDNCKKNTKELKKLDSWEIKASGTLLTLTADSAKSLAGLADATGNKVTLRDEVDLNDFSDLWVVADYSDLNGDKNGGFVAVHLMNVLSTGGFKMQTSDKEKGKFEFEYTAHYALDDDVVPMEIYIQEGKSEQ